MGRIHLPSAAMRRQSPTCEHVGEEALRTLEVSLHKPADQRMGLSLQPAYHGAQRVLQVAHIVPGGFVDGHNGSCEAPQRVRTGDMVVSVNGVREDFSGMIEELHSKESLRIELAADPDSKCHAAACTKGGLGRDAPVKQSLRSVETTASIATSKVASLGLGPAMEDFGEASSYDDDDDDDGDDDDADSDEEDSDTDETDSEERPRREQRVDCCMQLPAVDEILELNSVEQVVDCLGVLKPWMISHILNHMQEKHGSLASRRSSYRASFSDPDPADDYFGPCFHEHEAAPAAGEWTSRW